MAQELQRLRCLFHKQVYQSAVAATVGMTTTLRQFTELRGILTDALLISQYPTIPHLQCL